MLPHRSYLPIACAALALWPISLRAQGHNEKGPAYTQPPQDDPSYPLMGEFVGAIKVGQSEGESKRLGLQIRAVGGDEFDAISFLGGLPGQEAHDPQPERMIGRRSDDFVILSGGPWVIVVEKESCLLLDRKGEKVGTLERIQRTSPTLGARPPEGAMVLFDGSDIDQFTNAQMTADKLLMEGADVKPMFQDFNLHVEFRLPYMPEAEGQSRGNSGLYLQSRYECQVLDSFALDPLFNGLGSLYRFKAPDLNMCLPPLVWQTYDIQFTAPRWASDGSKIRDAHITSWVNGVKVQDNVALPNKTGAGKQEEPVLLPTKIQDHGDPVRFRNIWVVDRGLSTSEFPVYPNEQERAEMARAELEAKAGAGKAEEAAKAEEATQAEDAAKADDEQKSADASKAEGSDQGESKVGPEPADPESEAPEATGDSGQDSATQSDNK